MSDPYAPGAKGLIDPRYCCCAVPLVNAGIYTILGEQTVIGAAVGILVLATPDVVGASFPTIGNIILAIICFVIAGAQPIGFIGVLREKTTTFKIYLWINTLAILAAFACSAALIISSALKHDTAVSACETKYFSDTGNSTSTANSTLSAESEELCSAFAWADVGIMGGLWVIMILVQLYFIYLTRVYSTSQVSDHKLYQTVYSENPEAFTMSVLRSSRYNPGSMYNTMPGPHADVWESRPSMDSAGDRPAHQQPQRGYSDQEYRDSRYEDAYGEQQYDQQPGYPSQYHDGYREEEHGGGQYPFTTPGGGYVNHPAEAMMRDEEITPVANQYSEGQGVGYSGVGTGGDGLHRPDVVQSHPGGH